MLDGNAEFPSIATKTRPADDALMDYSFDVICLHMSTVLVVGDSDNGHIYELESLRQSILSIILVSKCQAR
jgi:hypothetical protein